MALSSRRARCRWPWKSLEVKNACVPSLGRDTSTQFGHMFRPKIGCVKDHIFALCEFRLDLCQNPEAHTRRTFGVDARGVGSRRSATARRWTVVRPCRSKICCIKAACEGNAGAATEGPVVARCWTSPTAPGSRAPLRPATACRAPTLRQRPGGWSGIVAPGCRSRRCRTPQRRAIACRSPGSPRRNLPCLPPLVVTVARLGSPSSPPEWLALPSLSHGFPQKSPKPPPCESWPRAVPD